MNTTYEVQPVNEQETRFAVVNSLTGGIYTDGCQTAQEAQEIADDLNAKLESEEE